MDGKILQGSCHCGDFTFTARQKETPAKVFECDCSYCIRTGFQFGSSFLTDIEPTSDWSNAGTYQFGQKRYTHLFCTSCGSSVAIKNSAGHVDVVNVRLITDLKPKSLPVSIYNGASVQTGYDIASPSMPETLEDGNLQYHGSCHCQAVKYTVSFQPITSANECGCSICWRNAYLWIYPMKPDFKVSAGEGSLSVYQFGQKSARHSFCKVCGVNLFNLLQYDFGPVPINVRTLEGIQVLDLERKPQQVRVQMPNGDMVEKEIGDFTNG